MNKPMIRIHNIETDEVIDREMTDEEFAQFQATLEADKLARKEYDEALARRQSALSKLIDLGLTEEEIAAL